MNERLLGKETNDIFLVKDENGIFQVARTKTKSESVMQTIRTVLQTFKGELFTDPDIGVPWFQRILGKDVTFIDAVRDELRETIMNVKGVTKVKDISIKVKGRNFTCSYTIIFGDGTSNTDEYKWQI